MATLSKHGEIGQIDYGTWRVAFCADGEILRNQGDGWKRWKHLKDGLSPKDILAKWQARYEQTCQARPCYARYARILREYGGSLYGRRLLDMLIESMPTDPDGIWSELADSYDYKAPKPSLDEVIELCRAWSAAREEMDKTTA